MMKRMKQTVTLMLTLVMVTMSFASFAETAPAATNAAGKAYVLGEFANTPLDVSQYKGKAIWLNFFTGWCSYCMEEMPAIKETFDTYDPNEVAIVLVHVWDGENADDSAAVVERFNLQDMILLEDEQMTLATLIGLQGYPTSVFIDKNGYLSTVTYTLDAAGMATALDAMGVAKRVTATDEAAQSTPAPSEVVQ